MNLTESQKKMLSEWLGECWHDPVRPKPGSIFRKCSKCGSYDMEDTRTFLDPRDQQACIDKLVKEGKWEEFWWYAAKIFCDTPRDVSFSFAAWLIRPVDENGAHFCRLVAEFLEKGAK